MVETGMYTMTQRNMWYTIGRTLISLDSVINCVCIMLSFGFHHNLYSLLCQKCDVTCRWCCVKLSQRSISKIVYATSEGAECEYEWECEEMSETTELFGIELLEFSKTKTKSNERQPSR